MNTFKQFKKILKLDKINLEIFKNLSVEGKINYSKIGKEFGVSHVSIKNRYENLLKRNIIKPTILVNFSALNFKLAILLLELETAGLQKMKDLYSKCPRALFSFNLMGEYNHLLVFFGEDLETVETMFNSCMLQDLGIVRKSNMVIFGKLKEDLFLPLSFSQLDQTNKISPCGSCCKLCNYYIQEQCIGCPASKYYKGPLKLT